MRAPISILKPGITVSWATKWSGICFRSSRRREKTAGPAPASMCPGDVRLAEKSGFSIFDLGYKVYYSYEMAWGKLELSSAAVEQADPHKDLDEYAEIAARWHKRPPEWCRALLAEWHTEGLIAHLGIREQGKLVAACMAAPNDVRPSTAAIYSIFTPDEHTLKPLLANVVARCVEAGVHNVIADLIHEHRQFEPVYRQLGFQKAADWARCEKILA
jgi:hypothetical protein